MVRLAVVDYVRPVQTQKQEIIGANIYFSQVDFFLVTFYLLTVLTSAKFTPVKTVSREP